MTKLDLSKIFKIDFSENQYFKKEYNKKQIVLHHTGSGKGVDGDFKHWLSTPERIATCVIIDHKGKIYQCFSSKYWAHHLGITLDVFIKNKIPLIYRNKADGSKYVSNNEILNQESIAVEIDSWGGLTKKGDKWVSYTGAVIPKEEVVEYERGYRGFMAYQKYTDEQIESLIMLLRYWGEIYSIPLNYNEDMWDVSKNALNGNKGIWTHTSFRYDKSDCHPQKELIQALKSL
jgi:N-acetyl-anhydromuramyl-L-alanine amidase AmpD